MEFDVSRKIFQRLLENFLPRAPLLLILGRRLLFEPLDLPAGRAFQSRGPSIQPIKIQERRKPGVELNLAT